MCQSILILLLLLLSGCATASIKTSSVDGKVVACEGYYTTLFKDIDAVNLSACGGKGNAAGSKVNTLLLQELLKAALVAVP